MTLDVYVCNFRQDNSAKAQALSDSLVELFVPGHANRNDLRGCTTLAGFAGRRISRWSG